MKILIVEDDPVYVKNIQSELNRKRSDFIYSFATSKDSAQAAILSDFYDLIILDLKIPTVDNAMDAEPEHGYLAFEFARQNAPGTPLFVLTGSSAEPFLDRLLENINQVDIWGTGKIKNISFLAKHKFGSSFLNEITPYVDSFSTMMDVEIQGDLKNIDKRDSRIIRIFANTRSAVKCTISILGGGLSGAKVISINMTDAHGAPSLQAVAKLGNKTDVLSENSRFEAHITRLNSSATPRKLALIEYGAADYFGVFYSLATGYESNAFILAARDDAMSEDVVTKISEMTQPWRAGIAETRSSVKEIRQHGINDEKFAAIRNSIPFSWIEEFEKRNLQSKGGCCHCDLHGLNVLTTTDGRPILIDYGDVGHAPASWDAVTLELSLIFHKDGPLRNSSWPTYEQARSWGDLDIYLVNCPMPRFVTACRNWAASSSAGQREIAACAYAYLVRQVKYDDTDKAKAIALIEGAKAFFDKG